MRAFGKSRCDSEDETVESSRLYWCHGYCSRLGLLYGWSGQHSSQRDHRVEAVGYADAPAEPHF
jgi:hypothetical protein